MYASYKGSLGYETYWQSVSSHLGHSVETIKDLYGGV